MKVDERFWNELAEGYAAKPVEDVPAYERKLAITTARLKPRDVILDVGCGTGSLALELAPHVARVHAVDVSSKMLEIGRRKAEEKNVDNVTFHHSTAQELPHFEPQSFDGVCAYNILHLVRERPPLYQQVVNLLRPGGFFISSTVCLADSYVPYRAILAVMRLLGKAPAVEILGVDQVLAEMRDAGFVDVSLEDVGAKKVVAFITANRAQ